ncbi:MAG: hypothetical protein IPP27_03945 [Bacteroidetes bacterium]|nr:hypothetical protein [Bacteroidota bacterium]
MFKNLITKNLSYAFLALIAFCFSSGCGSDKQGDEIGALKKNEYPESYDVRKNEVFVVNGVRGPEDKSVLQTKVSTSWTKYSAGSSSRLAILLTDTTASWLGLAHGLKSIGVPFLITTDYRRALQSKVVMVYPIVSGASLSPDALQALAAFPRDGGTLIGSQVLGALNEVFGFDEPVPSKQHFEIVVGRDSSNEITKEFRDDKETHISIGNKEKFKETIGTYSYSKPRLAPIATYEDKSAAITQRFYENGNAYALGFDLGYLILKGHNIRHEDYNRSPANSFEPTLDVLLRLIKNIYIASSRDAAYVSTVPYNKDLSVCITHNVNFKRALEQSASFARKEKESGIRSTFFVQTQYIRDRTSGILFSNEDINNLKAIGATGMDIQSNTVSGSPLFDQFEQGTGDEVYHDYRPYVIAYEKTYHGTIFGEMRVSRYLLDHFIPGNNTSAFRSTYSYVPFTYPQSLLASGYRFSSSVPANLALTHLPFQMNHNREYDSEVEAFEFPVTDDDEVPPFDLSRTASAIKLAKKIARYGGCFIGQVHPNEIGWQIERDFVKAVKDFAWIGSFKDFGLWWAARNEVTIDITSEGGSRVVKVNVPKRMEGLAIMLPLRSTPTSIVGGGKYSVDGKLVIFELAEGEIRITLNN